MPSKTGRPPGKKYPLRLTIAFSAEEKTFLTDNFGGVSKGIHELIAKAMSQKLSDTALPNEEEFDPWVPLGEAAKFIGVSASNLRKYCALGIWGEKIGRNWFMRKSEVFDVKKMFDRNEFDENGLYTG